MNRIVGGLVAVMAAAVALAGGVAFDSGTASAGYYIGYVSYRITPSVVDGWTLDGDSNVDAQEKAAAKALLWENMIDCETYRIDTDNDGNLDSVSANCEGVGSLHIRYDGRGRGDHPGTAGSSVNWSDTGATGVLGNANIIGCHRAALAPPDSRNGCTATELAGFAATGTYTPDS